MIKIHCLLSFSLLSKFKDMRNSVKITLLTGVLMLVGCQRSEKLIISGYLDGVAGDTLTIGHLVNNELTEIEFKVLKKSGNFKFTLPKQAFPPFYFLQINNAERLVIIRDSSDLIRIESPSASIANAEIVGSSTSVRIQQMMKDVMALRMNYASFTAAFDQADNAQEKQQLSDDFLTKYKAVKKAIGYEIYKDPRSYFSYYALFQRISKEHLLFSPYDEEDYKYFAAVATAYNVYHKDDPRTRAIYDMVSGVLAERRRAKLQQMVEDAPGGLPDIVMNDYKGVERKLSDLEGKVVVLNFWASKSIASRSLNKALLDLYDRYKSKGLEVFQVSADKSKILWEAAIEADRLPWINVCDFKEEAGRALTTYNVRQLPTTFLISRKGEVLSRYDSFDAIEKAVMKELE